MHTVLFHNTDTECYAMKRLYCLVVFVGLISQWPVKAYDSCFDYDWTYHNHTHSCFKFYQQNSTWNEAESRCSNSVRYYYFYTSAHLIRIDDSLTNDFVKSLLPENKRQIWIGLHYQEEVGDYRWDGFPDESVRYNDPNWVDKNLSLYVSIDQSGWISSTPDTRLPFICQHQAKKVDALDCKTQVVQGSGLHFNCTVENSSSPLTCNWRYSSEGEIEHKVWSKYDIAVLQNPRKEMEWKDTYYNTTCFQVLTAPFRITNIQGILTLQMRMYPYKLIAQSSTDDKFMQGTLEVHYRKPEKPIFSTSNLTLLSQPLVIVEGYEFELTCHIYDPSPPFERFYMTCDSMDKVSNDTITSDSYSMTLVMNHLYRYPHCTCFGLNLAGHSGAGMGFLVLVPASNVTCNTELSPYTLLVNCTIGLISPHAVCQWSYRNEIYENSPWITTDQNASVDEVSIARYSYAAYCSIIFAPNTTTFRPGTFSFRLVMEPFFNQSFTVAPGHHYTKEIVEAFEIELPNKPMFKVLTEILQDNTTLSVVDGHTLGMACEVNSGKPTVQSVTLSCDFPVNDLGEKNHTFMGTSYSMTTKVSRDLDGKTCSCWGTHLTGSTYKSTVQIKVTYLVIRNFVANGNSSGIILDLNQKVTVSCDSDGISARSVLITKNTPEKDIFNISQGIGQATTTFQARCSHNGLYRCDIQTTINDTIYSDTKRMAVHVICPPSVCENEDVNPSFDFETLAEFTVSLCAVAYPLPNMSLFSVEKAHNEKWIRLRSSVFTLTLVGAGETLTGVQINFKGLDVTDHGQYRLFYPQEQDRTYSFLHFQLNEPSSTDSSSGLSTGIVSAIILGGIAGFSLMVVVSVVCVYKILRKSDSSNNEVGKEAGDFDGPRPSEDGFYGLELEQNQSRRIGTNPYLTPIEGSENQESIDSTYESIDEDVLRNEDCSYSDLHPDDTSYRYYCTIQDSHGGEQDDDYLEPRPVIL